MIIIKFLETHEKFGLLEAWTPEGAKVLHNLLMGLSPSTFHGNGINWPLEKRLGISGAG